MVGGAGWSSPLSFFRDRIAIAVVVCSEWFRDRMSIAVVVVSVFVFGRCFVYFVLRCWGGFLT